MRERSDGALWCDRSSTPPADSIVAPEESRIRSRHIRAYNKGIDHFRAGRYKEALASFLEADSHIGGDAETQKMIARSRAALYRASAEQAANSGDFDAALALLDKAQEIYPLNSSTTEKNLLWVANTIRDKGWKERVAGNLVQAEKLMRHALQLDPSNAKWHDELGLILKTQKRYDEAVAEFVTALEYAPHDASILEDLAISEYYRDRLDESEANFREVLLTEARDRTKKAMAAVAEDNGAGSDAWATRRQAAVAAADDERATWRATVKAKLEHLEVPEAELAPRPASALRPGDIVLLAPSDVSSQVIAVADQLYTGRFFRGDFESKASHALTFLGRDARRRALFLDNTLGRGPHVIGQTEFEQEYGKRPAFMATPTRPMNGRILLEAALSAADQQKDRVLGGLWRTGWGVWGTNNKVCSELCGWAITRGTGTNLPSHRLGLIDLTPGDFFDEDHAGKYFIVVPLAK